MGRIFLIFSLLLTVQNLWATDTIQSDCLKPELKALRAKKILTQIAPEGKLNAVDCTVIKPGSSEKLLTIFSMDTESGVETHVAVFNRAGFSADSKPQVRSDSLGFDSYLMVVKGKKRMIFVLPEKSSKNIVFFTNTMIDANTTQFMRRELDLRGKTFLAPEGKAWKIDQGVAPKIYEEKGKWKVILKGKLLDLSSIESDAHGTKK